jgi:peptide deformylase
MRLRSGRAPAVILHGRKYWIGDGIVRPRAVRVESLTPEGREVLVEASGFYARVLQHEIDHLDGILTLDRAASPDDIEPAEASATDS